MTIKFDLHQWACTEDAKQCHYRGERVGGFARTARLIGRVPEQPVQSFDNQEYLQMNKITTLLITALFAVLSVTAYAQQPGAKKAPAATSSDPIVQMREAEAAVNKTYKDKVSAARKERAAQMKPMVDAAVKKDTANGADPLVAKRDAESKAKAATRKDYDAKVKAAKAERDAAIAEIRKNAAAK